MAGWMLYAIWAVLGLMIIDFLIGFFRSLATKSFSPKIILEYLKDILYYVFPLIFLMNIMPIDPTGWILLIFFYIGALGVIFNYLLQIKNKWKA
ncbi:hypothetical protein F7731_19245 [Cytobacillus depressus]|uniref:Uncharacterized protein n=1 Tax=Cytobacillus depressus TaxID=1602942 RepID=A0A6L3V266_9BACI|nr:hypothetical protein [Cytobacillus depressus]KAB2330740.1 hypothetical protein F7731_19245 [Cytobacillus depressus]